MRGDSSRIGCPRSEYENDANESLYCRAGVRSSPTTNGVHRQILDNGSSEHKYNSSVSEDSGFVSLMFDVKCLICI